MLVGPAPTQRLVIELVKKILHSIISSRFLAGDCEQRSISTTFNLETVEIQSVKQAIESIPLNSDWATPVHVDICTSSNEDPAVVLLERWSVSVQSSSIIRMSPGRAAHSDSLEFFQHALILTRSLHCLLRVLPAHNLYSNGQAALDRLDPLPFAIFYFLTSGAPDPERSFQDADCKNFVFSPVDSGEYGSVHLSVIYRRSFRYTPAVPIPCLSGSKIIPNYISPSPRSSAARDLIESHNNSMGNAQFAIMSPNPKPNSSLKIPILRTVAEHAGTFTPARQLPWLNNISSGSPLNSSRRRHLITSRHKDISPPIFPEAVLSEILPDQTEGLGFARLEPGSDHSQVGELLTVIKQAPNRLVSLQSVSLKTILESLEESLSQNRSLNERASCQ